MSTSAALPRPTADVPVLAVSSAALALVAALLARDGAWRSVALLAVAAVLGAVFLRTSFGYTVAFRSWLTRRDGSGLAAGIVVAMVAAVVIIPVASLVPGYSGFEAPIGPPLIAGAMLFGAGMQWANGCGSGTLYTAGGGSPRMWVTLPFFCVGGLLGSLLLPAAFALPALPEVVFARTLGPWGGLALTLLLAAGLAGAMMGRGPRPDAGRLKAACLIGGLAAVAFLVSGQPWGVTTGLTLWGAKAAAALGFDIAHTAYWSWDGPKQALAGSVLAQDSSLMDIGMVLGATVMAARLGTVRLQPAPPLRGFVGAAIGGLLMGIGARLSFGCNIGALVGGIASGSLHGFVWFFAVLPGCWVGVRLRPLFGL
jgi:uncharacterized protein